MSGSHLLIHSFNTLNNNKLCHPFFSFILPITVSSLRYYHFFIKLNFNFSSLVFNLPQTLSLDLPTWHTFIGQCYITLVSQ